MAMDHPQALPSLDVWTSALLTKSTAGRGSNGRLGAYGIKKLRELILELAVRGKLVPQDPNDEPASELLKRIAVEKARLIAEGRIREGKLLSVIGEEEKTNQLPQSWEWSRIADLTSVLNGRAYSKQELLASGTPVLRVGNLFTSNDWYYSNLELEEDKYCDAGDLIFAWSASFGPFIWAGPKVIFHYHIWKLNLYSEADINKNYLYKFLLEKTQEMKASGHGVSMIHMTKEAMEKMVVPVPPLAEQHRIVAKVDELMALCDQLEQRQTDSLAAHQALVETLLGTLTQPAVRAELVEARPSTGPSTGSGRTEFDEAWARIASHFDTLFTTEASIDQLKQTLLQLAVMGKLVPQDPNDEPVNVFLERIGKEKERLIREGKIKKDKPLPGIANGMPFEIPDSWNWVSFEDVVDITSGVTLGRKVTGKRLVTMPYLRVANVQRGYLDLDQMKVIELTEDELDKYLVMARDLLITEGGDWDKVGRTAIWRDELPRVAHQNHVFKARCFLDDQNEVWLEKYLNSEAARNYFAGSSKQTTNLASINKTQLRRCPVAMPPINEQHRIVAKVDELMALCDALKARIKDAQTTQLHLADAIVEQAVR